VTVEQFDQQIQFMMRHYHPLTVSQLIEKSANAYHRGFLITFDDGFRNNTRLAAPVLKKYGIQGCFFVTTGHIGKKEMIWPEKLTYLILGTNKTHIRLHLNKTKLFKLTNLKQRIAASVKIREYLKKSSKEKIYSVLSELEEQAGEVNELNAHQKDERYAYMDWEDVRAMKDMGQLVGSHTHKHQLLSSLDAEQSQYEIEMSKRLLDENAGIDCRYFSYPNGTEGDYNYLHINQLRSAGYLCAFTQIQDNNYPHSDLFELRRINIDQGLGISKILFEAKVCNFLGRVTIGV
jgi:peptidoglycan/xylan/chitin deacetylase (PgdA/CDA1 family)